MQSSCDPQLTGLLVPPPGAELSVLKNYKHALIY